MIECFVNRGVDFGDILGPEVRASHRAGTTYDLLANIVHDGEPGKGTYRVHILHKVCNRDFFAIFLRIYLIVLFNLGNREVV